MSGKSSTSSSTGLIPILMYHSVSERVSRRFRTFSVTPALFREHCRYLQEGGYSTLTVSDLADLLRRDARALPERPVILTFDDGFADFREQALDVLVAGGLTATLYVVADYLGGQSRWLRDRGEEQRRTLSWSELREVHAAGVECGSHSRTHPQLDVEPEARARDEIFGSKKALEDGIGAAVRSFAYPFGYFNRRVRELVRESAYESA